MLGACRLSSRPVARSSYLRRLLAAAPMKSVPAFAPVPLRRQLAFQGFVLPAAAVVSRTVMDQLRREHRQARRVISNELLGASYIVFECGIAPTEPHHITRLADASDVLRKKMSSSERNRFHTTSRRPRRAEPPYELRQGSINESEESIRPTPADTLPHPLASPRTRCPSHRRGSSESVCPIRSLLLGSWPGPGNTRRSLPCSR